ncbi:hypothetical protein ABZ567_20890 [Streptomyces sp. NPDC016459]|uniref:hypothetical protein n=1 Tax=Streptomyces sp. NPDC016459 TaxID=3157190 RepID=UPI0033CA6772
MSQLTVRRALAGAAAGAALVMSGATGTAHAGTSNFYVSLQTNSNVRTAPTTSSTLVLNTGSTVARYYMDGLCYVRGQYVRIGTYGTDVWYHGHVVDGRMAEPTRHHVYVWGGNVNVGDDPAGRPC